MSTFKVCIVGGHCSNRVMIVAEQLTEFFEKTGIACQVFTHLAASEYAYSPRSNLILQLLPAFTEEEAGVPVIKVLPSRLVRLYLHKYVHLAMEVLEKEDQILPIRTKSSAPLVQQILSIPTMIQLCSKSSHRANLNKACRHLVQQMGGI